MAWWCPSCAAVLADFDVIYAPLITSYGSCSGALGRSTVFHP